MNKIDIDTLEQIATESARLIRDARCDHFQKAADRLRDAISELHSRIADQRGGDAESRLAEHQFAEIARIALEALATAPAGNQSPTLNLVRACKRTGNL